MPPRNRVMTPADIEDRYLVLSRELDEAYTELEDAEYAFHTAKATYELKLARTRLDLIRNTSVKMTVGEREDEAITICAEERRELGANEARARAARGNVSRIQVQVDLARSMGTSIRTAMDLS